MKFDPFSSIRNYHKLAYVWSSPEVAFNFIWNCPKLHTKFNQVSFWCSCEVAMNFICTYNVAQNFLRSWPEVRFVRSWPEVRFVRSWPEVRFVRSWPEVCAKLARSLHEVGPKFVWSGPEICVKWARSFAAKFASKCKHITCAYRISDKELTQKSGMLQLLTDVPGFSVMADRGFWLATTWKS